MEILGETKSKIPPLSTQAKVNQNKKGVYAGFKYGALEIHKQVTPTHLLSHVEFEQETLLPCKQASITVNIETNSRHLEVHTLEAKSQLGGAGLS